mgnify:CR=1 FL=1
MPLSTIASNQIKNDTIVDADGTITEIEIPIGIGTLGG